jgi:hypothetical protein
MSPSSVSPASSDGVEPVESRRLPCRSACDLECCGVGVGLGGEVPAEVQEIVLVGPAFGEEAKSVGEPPLCFVKCPDGAGHGCGHRRSAGAEAVFMGAGVGPSPAASRSSRTAATLKSGCFETGSKSVSVSSFAARGRPFGPAAS